MYKTDTASRLWALVIDNGVILEARDLGGGEKVLFRLINECVRYLNLKRVRDSPEI